MNMEEFKKKDFYMKYIIVIALLLLMQGCQLQRIPLVNSDEPLHLEENYGYFFLPLYQNRHIREITIFGAKDFQLDYRQLRNKTNTILLKLPEGNYSFNSMKLYDLHLGKHSLNLVMHSIFNEERFHFTIEKGKVNYLGHMYVNYNADVFHASTFINLVNSSEKTKQYLTASYPGILEMFPFVYVGKDESKTSTE